MAEENDNWLVKESGPHTAVGGYVVFTKHLAGYQFEAVYTKHFFQFDGMGAGTVSIEALGPADTWEPLPTSGPHADGDIVVVNERFKAYRFVFTGAGEVYVKSFAEGW